MLRELVKDQYNLQIFNYEYIFKNYIERQFIDDLYSYKLLEKKKDSTVRRLFIHHNIHAICDYILKEKKKGKQVLFFDYHNLLEGEILEYIEESRIKSYLNYTYHKIKSTLPMRIYFSTFSFEYFIHKYEKNAGIGIETMLKIRNLAENNGFEKFTFEKVKKFVKREELTFLDKTYFNSLKSKQLLIN